MSKLSAKTTAYLDPKVKKFIQYKAISENTSVSDIINDYFEDMLEDLSDIKEINKRQGKSTVSFDKLLADLDLTYEDLQN